MDSAVDHCVDSGMHFGSVWHDSLRLTIHAEVNEGVHDREPEQPGAQNARMHHTEAWHVHAEPILRSKALLRALPFAPACGTAILKP